MFHERLLCRHGYSQIPWPLGRIFPGLIHQTGSPLRRRIEKRRAVLPIGSRFLFSSPFTASSARESLMHPWLAASEPAVAITGVLLNPIERTLM